jgi:hypothetical protein
MRTTNLRNQLIRLVLLFGTLALAAFLISACNGSSANSSGTSVAGGGSSPTEAYKNLYAAVKSKNVDSIKKQMSKGTLQFAEMVAGQQNKKIEQVLENGFLASTKAPALPPIRDERTNGNMGAVEVWDSQNSRWEDAPFILEDGVWKLAVGNAFQGAWESPGKGQSAREREAANTVSNNMIPAGPNSNANFNGVKPMVPKERPEADAKK